MSVDGILNINKPAGKTSFDLVALVRRLSGERHVGHAGTLDPVATGVLPICLGQGRRVIEFLVNEAKAYRALIELGIATETYDVSGKVTQREDPGYVTREDIEGVLSSFRGIIEQVPPMYSAVRHGGKRLYQLARAGYEVDRKARKVQILRLDIVEWQPPVVTVEVECGKGTYVRSLAHDLGQVLGCGAHLKELVRLSYGPFDIEDALSISQLEDSFRQGYWLDFLYPIDAVLLDWMAVIVGDDSEIAIRNGRHLLLDDGEQSDTPALCQRQWCCRAYTGDGRFLAVLRSTTDEGRWHPQKVFLT